MTLIFTMNTTASTGSMTSFSGRSTTLNASFVTASAANSAPTTTPQTARTATNASNSNITCLLVEGIREFPARVAFCYTGMAPTYTLCGLMSFPTARCS
jgi:hypothetical protein